MEGLKNLYLKQLKGISRPRSIAKFLELFYFSINKQPYACTTYFDKECKKLHCYGGRGRSFDDLLILAKTYYPSITPKILMHNILIFSSGYESSYTKTGKIKCYFYLSNCGTIERIKVGLGAQIDLNYNSIININKYKSKYSWDDLLKMLKITSQQELINYRNKYIKYESIIKSRFL